MANYTVTYIKLYGKIIGASGDLVVEIQGVDGNNLPDGNNLGSVTEKVSSTWNTVTSWRTITFNEGIVLDSETQYALVLSSPDSDGDNHPYFYFDSIATYADGKLCWYDFTEEVWKVWDDAYDCTFVIGGNEEFTSYTEYSTLTVVYGASFKKAQTFVGTPTAPGKAQNPTPSDNTENIKIIGINQLKKLQWEAPD